jgi:8-oxo-dGTP pyrophosphatase MutT (NUDIX family)
MKVQGGQALGAGGKRCDYFGQGPKGCLNGAHCRLLHAGDFAVFEPLEFLKDRDGFFFTFDGWLLPETRKKFKLFVPLGFDCAVAMDEALRLLRTFGPGSLFSFKVNGKAGKGKLVPMGQKLSLECGAYGMGVLEDGSVGLMRNINSPGGQSILYQIMYYQLATGIGWPALAACFKDGDVPDILFVWEKLEDVERSALAGRNHSFWSKWSRSMKDPLTETVNMLGAAIYLDLKELSQEDCDAVPPAGPLQFAGGQFGKKDKDLEKTFQRELKEEVQLQVVDITGRHLCVKSFGDVKFLTRYFVASARPTGGKKERISFPFFLSAGAARDELSNGEGTNFVEIFDALMLQHERH